MRQFLIAKLNYVKSCFLDDKIEFYTFNEKFIFFFRKYPRHFVKIYFKNTKYLDN